MSAVGNEELLKENGGAGLSPNQLGAVETGREDDLTRFVAKLSWVTAGLMAEVP